MVSAVVPTIPTAPSTDLYEVANADHSITTRDVCILGGGASGTFAAIRLKAMGKSVVVIESQDKLGVYIPLTQVDSSLDKQKANSSIRWPYRNLD
jgi:heterodisulfide reductase subunit A-like polyferredoxin